MILKHFSANLSDTLAIDDKYLPLNQNATARLLALLNADGEEIYLTISDDVYKEHVLITLVSGTPVLTRGVDSDPHKFPKGSCVFFELSLPVVKWLICNHQCCEDDCAPDPVVFAGAVFPPATINQAWEGTMIFKGDTPVAFGVTGMPAWMTAEYAASYIRFYGTPTGTGSYTIAAAASNNRGSNTAVGQATVTVTSE